MKRGSLLFLFNLCIHFGIAQDSLNVSTNGIPNFIKLSKDTLTYSSKLNSFFEKLYNVKNQKHQINIVHIGDSHIQADFLTNTIRQLLQKEFGNAGRGLIFPGRIAKTNEPMNIRSSTKSIWEAKRIVFTNNPLPIGIGAATVKTQQNKAKFSIRLKNNPLLDYSSSELIVFFDKDSASFNLIVKDSLNNELAYVGSYADDGMKNSAKIHLPSPVNFLEFETQQSVGYQNHFTLFGFSYRNQRPGVIYHSIGGNGAKFKHYLVSKYFFEQIPQLSPDLIIISLGTNEAMDDPNIDKSLSKQVEEFIEQLKKYNPDVPILLTTPSDFYKKKTRRNPGVEEVVSIVRDGTHNKAALWDSYEISGGKHSADKWRKFGLLQTDGIHSAKEGYELQGKLLFQALMNGYKNYVQHRHP
jgi:hypothetical protein